MNEKEILVRINESAFQKILYLASEYGLTVAEWFHEAVQGYMHSDYEALNLQDFESGRAQRMDDEQITALIGSVQVRCNGDMVAM